MIEQKTLACAYACLCRGETVGRKERTHTHTRTDRPQLELNQPPMQELVPLPSYISQKAHVRPSVLQLPRNLHGEGRRTRLIAVNQSELDEEIGRFPWKLFVKFGFDVLCAGVHFAVHKHPCTVHGLPFFKGFEKLFEIDGVFDGVFIGPSHNAIVEVDSLCLLANISHVYRTLAQCWG